MNISTSFQGDNGFVRIHAIVSYSLLVLGLILNSLVFILVQFSKRITDFRNVFYTYCVANTIFAVVFSISLMQWVFLPGMAVYFPTGPFAHNLSILPMIFRLQTAIYVYVMCLVCATFVYRYLIIVRPNSGKMKARAMTALTFSPVVIWYFTHYNHTIIPDTELREQINNEIGERFELDFQKIHLFVVKLSAFQLDAWYIFRLLLTAIQLNLMNIVMIWAGIRIYQTIQRSVGSQHKKKTERNAFRLLLSQAINPIILLHSPTMINYIQSEIVVLPNTINQVSCVLMTFFTVTNPLLNILFSKDLTNSLTPGGRKESMRKKSSIFVSQSNL